VKSIWLPSIIFIVAALIDDLTTYICVKVFNMYGEANIIVDLYFLDNPAIWVVSEVMVLVLVIVLAVFYRKLIEIIIKNTRKDNMQSMKIINFLASRWTWIVWFVAIIRILPIIHNALLIFFGIETPLSSLVKRITTSIAELAVFK